ncbi:dockerin type I domain-containing protein [Herbivorax sp. ANBcel31]|uniref:dockerin type I domain-containing protein n=1 Tax=Herbivorax sp. ANBcel31 TaxID=3069754 RepID=UPI0027B0139B|nr:dockerin type I domain-containing protein [Herbivorax sp. ANBcel31]MDQ2086994.1 dockerin type I domain-containing protein [Herbivorax sp. ANBcel31]
MKYILKKMCVMLLTVSMILSNMSVLGFGMSGQSQSLENIYQRKITIGDLNFDGTINSSDYAMLCRIVLNDETIKKSDAKRFIATDINGDDYFDSLDITLMRRYILGIIDDFPVDNVKYLLGDLTGNGNLYR